MPNVGSQKILTGVIVADTYSDPKDTPKNEGISFQAMGTVSAGTGTAMIKIWVSNDPDAAKGNDQAWAEAGTLTLSLTTTKSQDSTHFGPGELPYRKWKVEVDAISGTDATVEVWVGS